MIDWNNIAEIAITCVASVGGVGAIIVWIAKVLSDSIADKLSKKYQLQLDKEKEKYKTELNKKEYVSKTRFDAEFNIYRELSSAFCTMVKDISVMIPAGFSWQPVGKEAQKKYEDECYANANSSTVKAQDTLYASAAFIPENFFDGYESILKLCKQQLNVFAFRYNVLSFETKEEKRKLETDDYERTEEINEKWMNHNGEIRKYLSTLDVL